MRIVQESGVGEVTIEEAGMRVSVRRTAEPVEPSLVPTAEQTANRRASLPVPQADGFMRVEAPMVGTFYRAPQPGAPPFVEEGDAVAPGQTLCILEAMKLMNEVKAEPPASSARSTSRTPSPSSSASSCSSSSRVGRPPLDAV